MHIHRIDEGGSIIRRRSHIITFPAFSGTDDDILCIICVNTMRMMATSSISLGCGLYWIPF